MVLSFFASSGVAALFLGNKSCGRSGAACTAGCCGSCGSFLSALAGGLGAFPGVVFSLIGFSTLLGLIVLLHEDYTSTLTYAAEVWTILGILIRAVFLPLFALLRFLGFLLPVWNFFVGSVGIVFSETVSTAFACSTPAVLLSLNHLLEGGRVGVASLVTFIGAEGDPSLSYTPKVDLQGGGIMRGDLDLFSPLSEVQAAVGAQRDSVVCICETLSPMVQLFLFILESELLGKGIHHLVNGGVAFVQDLFQIIGEIDSFGFFERSRDHFLNGTEFLGLWVDSILREGASLLLRPLGISLYAPQLLLGGGVASFVQAQIDLAYSLFFRFWYDLLRDEKRGGALRGLGKSASQRLPRAWTGLSNTLWFLVGYRLQVEGQEYQALNSTILLNTTTFSLPPLACEKEEKDLYALMADPGALEDPRSHGVCAFLHFGLGGAFFLEATRRGLGGSLAEVGGRFLDVWQESLHGSHPCSDYTECQEAWSYEDAFLSLERAAVELALFGGALPGFRMLIPLPYELLRLGVELLRGLTTLAVHAQDVVEDEFIWEPMRRDLGLRRGDPSERMCRRAGQTTCTCNPRFETRGCMCIGQFPHFNEAGGSDMLQFYNRSDLWCGALVFEKSLQRASFWGALETSPFRRTVDILLAEMGQEPCSRRTIVQEDMRGGRTAAKRGLEAGAPFFDRELDDCSVKVGAHEERGLRPLCSGVHTAEAFAQVYVSVARQITTLSMNVVGYLFSELQGSRDLPDLSDSPVSLQYYLCDVKQFLGAISGVIPQTLGTLCYMTDQKDECEKLLDTELTVFLYHLLRYPLVVGGEEAWNLLILFFKKLVSGGALEDEAWILLSGLLTETMGWLADLVEALGKWLELVGPLRPVGTYLKKVARLLRLLVDELTEVILLWLRELGDVVEMFFQIFSGKDVSHRIVRFLTKLLGFLGKILIKGSMAVAKFVLGAIPLVSGSPAPLPPANMYLTPFFRLANS